MGFERIAAIAAFCLMPSIAEAAACGEAVVCAVDDGAYRIESPRTGTAKGVLVFFHGYKSSSELQMQHRALVEVAHAHGLAFAAVDGLNGTWSHPNAPGHFRDETRFIGHVLDDLHTRFGFDAGNTLVGGFSQGASMAWYTLCQLGERTVGAITFSGVFWDPLPQPKDCVTDIPPIVHFHGTADRTFPLTGRAIGKNFHQGDTFQSMAILENRASCAMKTTTRKSVGNAVCQVTSGCNRGEMALCLHDGGHEVRPENLDAGLTEIGF